MPSGGGGTAGGRRSHQGQLAEEAIRHCRRRISNTNALGLARRHHCFCGGSPGMGWEQGWAGLSTGFVRTLQVDTLAEVLSPQDLPKNQTEKQVLHGVYLQGNITSR